MLIWCLKQCKDFILKCSISRSFFSENEVLNLYTMILFYFSLGRCVDEVVGKSIRDANTCIFFSITYWQSSISWVGKEFVRLLEELFLIYTFVLTSVDDVNITKVKSHDEKPRDQRQLYILTPRRWGEDIWWFFCRLYLNREISIYLNYFLVSCMVACTFLIVIRIIKKSNLLYKDGLFHKLRTASGARK